MKVLSRSLVIMAVAVIMASCGSGRKSITPVTRITPLEGSGNVVDGSLIYALPMSVFNISVEFQKVVQKPGPYAKFASEMLGIKDVITKDSEKWSIIRIGISASEEVDPSEFYVIEANTIVETNALSLKKNGLILDINPASPEHVDLQLIQPPDGRDKFAFTDLGASEYFQTLTDTTYRLVKLDTAFIKIPYLVERKKQMGIEQLADKAARTLLELRDGKQFILTGEANVFPQGSAGIDEINRLEREYLALFAGKSASETKTVTYTYIPDRESSSEPVILFRFSEEAGPLDKASAEGEPVFVELTPAKKLKDITVIQKPQAEGEQSPSFDMLFYRIPEVAAIRVKTGNNTLYESRKLVYQLGQVVQLPANYIIGK